MQLSAFPPIVVPQPAAYQQPEADGNPGSPSGSNGTPFAQLLPVAAPATPPAAKADKKPEAATSAAEEATAALYGSWLAALAPQPTPVAALTKPVASAPATAGIGAGRLPIAGANLPGAPVFLPTGPSPSIATHGPGQATPTPHSPAAPVPVSAQAVPGNAAQAQPTATGKPAVPPVSAKPVSPATAPANVVSDAATSSSAEAGAPAGAMTPIRAATQLGAAGVGGAEKIAASPQNAGSAPAQGAKGQDKKILPADSKPVTESNEAVGIAVAKVAPVMPTAAPTERPPSAIVAPVPVLAVSSSSSQASGTTQGAVSQQGIAQNAVDAAISAAESLSTGNQQAVNMQFSVGNADLSLRVELKNGEIHTTFRTDSADLRLDLQHEWQSANPGSGTGSVRLAEPIFTSSGNASSSAAGEFAQQRGGQGRPDSSPSTSGNPGLGSHSPASAQEAEAPARMPASHSTSLHLQAFA
jgi:hypothetical protein